MIDIEIIVVVICKLGLSTNMLTEWLTLLWNLSWGYIILWTIFNITDLEDDEEVVIIHDFSSYLPKQSSPWVCKQIINLTLMISFTRNAYFETCGRI